MCVMVVKGDYTTHTLIRWYTTHHTLSLHHTPYILQTTSTIHQVNEIGLGVAQHLLSKPAKCPFSG
jgi:hypothetical protein